MKKSILRVMALALAMVLILAMFASCDQQGEQGLAGPKGEQGIQGEKGEDGNGISSIVKTSTEGLVDTYTITFTDGKTTTFTVTNGTDGEQGIQGIQGIQGVPGKDGHSPVITIQDGYWYIDGVKNNESVGEGIKGDTGNGISSIEKTNTEGLVDTYTITFTDGTTTTFTVKNGANGNDGKDGTNGKDGVDGEDGKDGQDGADGQTPYIKDGYWWIGDTNTNVKAEGSDGKDGQNGANGKDGVNGEDGKDGADGVSIVNAYVDENLHLWIVLSNDTKIDAGYVGITTTEPTPTTYTVTFVDYNGATLKTETVESGKSATAPTDPSRSGYRFIGWDKAFNNITGNLTVTAQYQEIILPTVIVNNTSANVEDGTVSVVISLINNPGISSLKFDVTYDSVLSLNNIVFDSAFGAYVTAPTPYGSPQTITCISPLSEVTASGTFATLTFEISDTVTSGTVANISLTLYADEIYDGDFEAVEFETINGTVTIAPNP